MQLTSSRPRIMLMTLALLLSWAMLYACPSTPPGEEKRQESVSELQTGKEITTDTQQDAGTESPRESSADAGTTDTTTDTTADSTKETAGDNSQIGGYPKLQAPNITVPTDTPDIVQIQPSLAVGNDGMLGMSYTAAEGDKQLGIFFVLIDKDGKAKGKYVRLDTFKGGNKTESSLCALAGGGYVAAWSMDTKNPDPKVGNLEVRFRIIDAAGKPVGTESTNIRTDKMGNHWLARLTCLKSGGFAVAAVYPDDGKSFGSFVQRFDAQGKTVGTDIKLNQSQDGNQAYPVVSAADDGSMAVVWEQGGTGEQGAMRLIAADGSTPNPEILLPKLGTTSSRPSVVMLPDTGELVVTVLRSSGAFAIYKYDKEGKNQQELKNPDTTSTNFVTPLLRSIGPSGTIAMVYMRGPNNNAGSPTVTIMGDASVQQGPFAITTGRIPLPYRPALAYDAINKVLWVAYTERTNVQGGLTVKLARFR